MSIHSAGYLAILEEVKKDLPWLMRFWLKMKKPKMSTTTPEQLKLNLNGPEVKLYQRDDGSIHWELTEMTPCKGPTSEAK